MSALFIKKEAMYIDLFIAILLVWALISGWRNGFLKEIVSTIGIISGLLIAALLYMLMGDNLLAVTGSTTNMFLSIVAFFILWIILPIVLSFVAGQLTRMLKGMQLGLPNCLLGMVFSTTKFALLLSCALNMMSRLDILDTEKTCDSHLYGPTIALMPFFGDQVSQYRSAHSCDGQASDTIWVDLKQQQQPAKGKKK